MQEIVIAAAATGAGSLLTLLGWVVWLLVRLVRAIEAVGCGGDCSQPVEQKLIEPPSPPGPVDKAALWQRVPFPS